MISFGGGGLIEKDIFFAGVRFCRPKLEGSLGIRPMRMLPSGQNGRGSLEMRMRVCGSRFCWQNIVFAAMGGTQRELVLANRACGEGFCMLGMPLSLIRFWVGNCERIRFWLDTWVRDGPLASHFPNLFCCA